MSLKNRLGNAKNEYQTNVKKVLCVCSAGMLRSPTLANVLHEKFGYNTRAVGAVRLFALVCVDQVLLKWADEVVFVEPDVFRDFLEVSDYEHWLKEYAPEVVVLDLQDVYEWNDPALRAACLEQYVAATSQS